MRTRIIAILALLATALGTHADDVVTVVTQVARIQCVERNVPKALGKSVYLSLPTSRDGGIHLSLHDTVEVSLGFGVSYEKNLSHNLLPSLTEYDKYYIII